MESVHLKGHLPLKNVWPGSAHKSSTCHRMWDLGVTWPQECSEAGVDISCHGLCVDALPANTPTVIGLFSRLSACT